MWFLFQEVSISSGYLGWAALFYCGTPWPFHIIISSPEPKLISAFVFAILCGCTAQFVSDLIGNPEDRFSHNEAHRILMVRRSSSTMLIDLLLQNRMANKSQILCGATLGRGNESLVTASGSHDQDGRHVHIW